MLNILITGARGQLGSSLRQLGSVSPNNYLATDVAELDITDAGAVLQTVKEQRIDVIVNCAAYTNVERAEEDEARADLLNHKAAAYLAAAAQAGGRRGREGLGMPLPDPAHGVALFGVREQLSEDDAASDLGA